MLQLKYKRILYVTSPIAVVQDLHMKSFKKKNTYENLVLAGTIFEKPIKLLFMPIFFSIDYTKIGGNSFFFFENICIKEGFFIKMTLFFYY